MKILIALPILFIPLFSCASANENSSSDIKVQINNNLDAHLAISELITKRCGKNLVRVLSYNTELEPPHLLKIEYINTPEFDKLLDSKSIEEISLKTDKGHPLVKTETHNLRNSQFVSFDNISLSKNKLTFNIDYTPVGKAASAIFFECSIDVSKPQIGVPDCHKIDPY